MDNAQSGSQATLNNWLRLGIPCCLGALAGVFNYLAIGDKLEGIPYCVVTETIEPGMRISESVIRRVDVVDGNELMPSAVPYAEVRGYLGSKVAHRVDKNSILLWQHVNQQDDADFDPKRELVVKFPSDSLGGADLPDQLLPGDRLMFHFASGEKTREIGPLKVSMASYAVDKRGKTIVDELSIIVRKNSRESQAVFDFRRKHNAKNRPQLIHVSRAA